MDPSKEDIRFVETSATDNLMPTPISWETWGIIGLALLGVMLLIWFLWRRSRRNTTPTPENLIKKAHDEALAALAVCPTAERTPAATECSLILRRYLVAVTGDPALFETHDEWIARHDSMESFDEELKQQAQTLFANLAEWKYSPADHGDEPAAMIDRSRHLLEAFNREVTA